MGHCGFYQGFIYMYAIIAKPLYNLISIFAWAEDCDKSFEKLKQALICAPIFKDQNYNEIFHVQVDALAYIIGCVLLRLLNIRNKSLTD